MDLIFIVCENNSMHTASFPRPASKARFHAVMLACLGFTIAMTAALVFVVSRPQTAQVQSAEQHAIAMCRQRSADPERTAIYRSTHGQACQEMEKQYRLKFGQAAEAS